MKVQVLSVRVEEMTIPVATRPCMNILYVGGSSL